MPTLVAIEVVAPEPPQAAFVASMLDACNAASAQYTCVSATPREHTMASRAHVVWDDPTRVTIEFYAQQHGSTPLLRTLDFDASDQAHERWRTVGFTTALLASTQPTPHVVVKTEPRLPNVVVTARALGERRMNQRPPQAGAELRLDVRAWEAAWLLGASAQYSATTWDAPGVQGKARWMELGAGVAVLLEPARELDLFIRVDALAQRLEVIGSKKNEQDTAVLWQPGARLALDLAWPFHPSWYAVVGAHTALVWAPVEVVVEDKQTEIVPGYSTGLSVGLQYRFTVGH